MTRGTTEVITVDADGTATGTAEVVTAHTGDGILHAAISVQVIDSTDRWLVQRRIDDKPTFGGWWANSCCSHPRPGEQPADAAVRRVFEELGIHLTAVHLVGTFTYRAVDPQSSYVEHEYDHVFVGRTDPDVQIHLDPDQIAETQWVSATEALALANGPTGAPWFSHVAQMVHGSLPPSP